MTQYAGAGSANEIFKTNEVTLAQLKVMVRERADMENSTFIGENELTTYINLAYGEYYDIVVSKYEDNYTVETEFTIASGATAGTLPSDFMKLRGLDYQNGSSFQSLRKFQFSERNNSRDTTNTYNGHTERRYRVSGDRLLILPEDKAPGTYHIWYVPVYPKLVAEADTIGGVNGWEDLVVIQAAIYMLQKEESDVSVLQMQKDAIIKRISSLAANRDVGGIETITDSTSGHNDGWDDGVY
jgi:hypothetical protein